MIDQYKVQTYLENELPEIEEELIMISPTVNIFGSIQCLVNYTKSKIINHDLLTVKKCFLLAEEIYFNGNALVKDAMENVFVFSLPSLLRPCGRNERNKIQSVMPLILHTAYVHQLINSII